MFFVNNVHIIEAFKLVNKVPTVGFGSPHSATRHTSVNQ